MKYFVICSLFLVNTTSVFAQEHHEYSNGESNKIQVNHVAQGKFYTFDAHSLFGGSHVDTDFIQFRTTNKNAIPVGTYSFNTVVNERSLGELVLDFQHLDSNPHAVLCIDITLLKLLDLKKNIIEKLPEKDCLTIKEISPDAYYELDRNTLNLNISLPLALINSRPQGYIAPERFEKGVTSAYLGYQLSQSSHRTLDSSHLNNTYLNLKGGINLGGFNYQHSGYFDSDGSSLTSYHSSLNTLSTDLISLGSRLTVGDFSTQTFYMDSASIRGVQVATDLNMLPMSQRSYAPLIKGMANTNALVSVFQNGRKIYEKTVPAGNFELNDLTAVGNNGDLTVQVTENGGEKHSFMVPLQGDNNLVRVGQFNYHASMGRYKFNNSLSDDYIGQLGLEYGLFNYLSLYTGISLSEPFQSYHLGIGANTLFGGIKLDAENTQFKYSNQDHQGQKYKFAYQYNFIPFSTSLSFSTLYQTQNYMALNNSFSLMQYQSLTESELENLFRTYKLKQQHNIFLSKNFNDSKWGSIYLNASSNRYWDNIDDYNQYSFGYSNTWNKINYSLGVSQSAQNAVDEDGDTRFYLSLSLPLNFKDKRASVYSIIQGSNQKDHPKAAYVGLSGTLGDDHQLNYALSTANNWTDHDTSNSLSANISYKLPQIRLEASTSFSDQQTQQFGLNATGAVVAHRHGLTLANEISDTFVIIHAKGAQGASVVNSWGTKVDRFGNAIYSNLSPYTFNSIRLDNQNLALDVNLKSNQTEVVPRRYSSPLVKFATEITSNIILNMKLNNQKKIPIGMQVYDQNEKSIGIFGQSNQIFLENSDIFSEKTTIHWGTKDVQFCEIDISKEIIQSSKEKNLFKIIDVECR